MFTVIKFGYWSIDNLHAPHQQQNRFNMQENIFHESN